MIPDRPRVVFSRRRAGVAMIETVLALPFLFVVLALVIFLGFGMVRLQRAASVDRYEAWRAQAYAPGPHVPAVSTNGGANERYNTDELLGAFYGGDRPLSLVAGVSTPEDSAAMDAAQSLKSLVPNVGANQEYAAVILESPGAGLPIGRRVTMEAEHEARSRFEETLGRVFTHSFTRPDGDWRYVNDVLDLPAEVWYDRVGDEWLPLYPDGVLSSGLDRPQRLATPAVAIRDLSFSGSGSHAGLNDVLAPIAAVNPLARTIQDFYLRVPGYRGPKLPTRAARNDAGEWVYEY